MRATALGADLLASSGASAESWDASIRRLCVSTTQQDCRIKAGRRSARRLGGVARNCPTPRRRGSLRRAGATGRSNQAGPGYVPERLMLIDSAK